MKKFVCMIVAVTTLILITGCSVPDDLDNSSSSIKIYTHEELIALPGDQLLNLFIENGLEMFNYDQSNEMLSNLGDALANLGLTTNSVRSVRSTYTLQKSTAIGSWSSSYQNYNCYAYSLGNTSGCNMVSVLVKHSV